MHISVILTVLFTVGLGIYVTDLPWWSIIFFPLLLISIYFVSWFASIGWHSGKNSFEVLENRRQMKEIDRIFKGFTGEGV